VLKRAKRRSPFQQSLRVTHPRLSLLGPRHLKWEETVASSLSHPRRNTSSKKVLVRSRNIGFSWSRPSKSCGAASRTLSPLWQSSAKFHNLRPLSQSQGQNPEPSNAILALKDKPGRHDLSLDTTVYVTKGRSGRKREYVTPGPQYPEYTLRTTWQWSKKLQQWQCQALRMKWKLLNEPHSVFDGNKVSAIQAFNTCRRQSTTGQDCQPGYSFSRHWRMLLSVQT